MGSGALTLEVLRHLSKCRQRDRAMGLDLDKCAGAVMFQRYIRPWLGVKMLDLNRAIVSQLKDKDPMFPDVSEGVLILMVTPGSPADVAGFYPGDVIVKFQGQPVKSIAEIIELMEDKVGIPMVVIVQRSNDTLETSTVVVPEETNPEL